MKLQATSLDDAPVGEAPSIPSDATSLLKPRVPRRRSRWGYGVDVVPLVLFVDGLAFLVAQWPVSIGALPAAVLFVLIVLLNSVGGHYKARIAPSVLDEFPSLAGRALIAGAIASAVLVVSAWPVHDGPVLTALLYLVVASLGRAVGYALVRHWRRHSGAGRATLIVGCGRVGNQLASTLLERREYGLRPVGFIDNDPLVTHDARKVPLLGRSDALTEVILDHGVSSVVFAFNMDRESTVVDLIRRCDRLRCEILFIPRLFELHGAGHDTEMVWGLPLTRLSRASYRSIAWRTKRIFDVVVTALALIAFAPVFALCALAVRFELGRGVLYRQERVGLDGRTFDIVKFRTLRPVAATTGAAPWCVEDHPEIGPIGRFLRRSSLDELPQLWNILRGDMSQVGPRPERPAYVEDFTKRFPRYVSRHRVPAGLTGWAQVNGLRGNTDIADRASFDNYYIENWSMWFDIKILLRTVWQVVGGRGR